jgi:hypothetical protein
VLDRHVQRIAPIEVGEWTLFIAPQGTPDPDLKQVLDPDGPWALLHPAVPDAPPES